MAVPVKRSVIVLALVFACTFFAHGQGIEHHLNSVRPTSLSAPSLPARPTPVASPSVASVQDFDEHGLAHHDRAFAGSSLFHTTRTPFMTQSRVPLAQAFGSRVQIGFVMTSTNNKNVLRGPLALPQSTQELAQPHASDQYGIGVSIPLGRDAGSSGSKGLWRGVSRVLHRR